MVLIVFTRGEKLEGMGEIREIIRDMNIHLTEAINDLATTKHDLGVALNELAKTKTELVTTKNDLATTKHDLNVALNELAEKGNELEREITRMRNPPYMHACGAHYDYQSIKSATIPYSTLLYSSTNTEGGGLDIDSSVFTSSWPGSYTHCSLARAH